MLLQASCLPVHPMWPALAAAGQVLSPLNLPVFLFPFCFTSPISSSVWRKFSILRAPVVKLGQLGKSRTVFLTLIPSAESLLSCKVICSQFRTLGPGHLWGHSAHPNVFVPLWFFSFRIWNLFLSNTFSLDLKMFSKVIWSLAAGVSEHELTVSVTWMVPIRSCCHVLTDAVLIHSSVPSLWPL